MKKFLLLIVSAAFCLGANAQQAQMIPLDKEVRYGKLENGLTYYIRHNEEPKDRVSFYIAQKVGSVQEDDNQRGLAHFLEHMCFNGSVNFPGDGQLIDYCESIGVKFGQNLNAYTSTDETVYNIDDIPVTGSNVDSCLLILHDWADGLLLEETEINKERGVIHEEWRMRSSAQQRILERQLPNLYPGSKYGNRMPIGLMEVIDNFAPEFLRAYYEKWYRPDLQGVVIVGDIDVDELEAKVKDIFGSIKMPENAAPYEFYPVPDNEQAIYVIDSDKEQQQPLIYMMYKTEPLGFENNGTLNYYIQQIVTGLTSQVVNERLNELSLNPDCPFLGAAIGYGTYLVSKTMDCFQVMLIPKEGRDAEAVQMVITEIERARRFGFNESELSRAKDEILSSIERQYDNRDKQKTSSFVNEYVRHFLDNAPAPGIETDFELYKALLPQLPAAALSQAFNGLSESVDKNFVFFAMYPEKEGVAVPTAEQMKAAVKAGRDAELEAYVDNVKDEPLIAKLPKKGKIKKESAADFGYTRLELSNGANVYIRKTDFSNNEVVMSGVSKGGLSLVPEKDLVNANLLNSVVASQGVGNFTSTELNKALAGKQASISFSLGQVSENISGSATPKDLQTLFELLYLRFQGLSDDPDAYTSTIQNLRSSLENAAKMPMTAFQDSVTSTIYGDNVRAKSIKLEDLAKADYATIKRIYAERFDAAGDFDFYFTGNFDEAVLKDYICQYIAPLKKAKKRENFVNWKIYPREGVITNRFTRKMETPQAYVIQAWSGELEYTMKNDVIVSAFGTILSNRYLKSIREDGGLSYSVSAQGQADFGLRDQYIIQAVCPFTPVYADEVLRLMRLGIDEIAKDGVREDELENFRKFELKEFTDSQRRNGTWQSIIRTKTMWGKDTYTGYEDVVNSITSKDIQDFVNNVLLKQNNCITVVMLPEDMTE